MRGPTSASVVALPPMQGARITQDLQPVYLLASSEPLLVRDWLDDARAALREAGIDDILNLQAEAGFDWNDLLEDSDTLSLFASSKCRIVTLPTGKPGIAGGKAIETLCAQIGPGDVFIFVTPALDRASRKAAWLRAIENRGRIVELKPVYDNQLADWILERARAKGLGLDGQAAQFLAERTEGNLLAADQELEKLSIRFAASPQIDLPMIEDSIAQSARYSHFLLVDACLAGQTGRALNILRSLSAEGYATPQLRWALQAALEQLDELGAAERAGGIDERTWQRLRVWRNKQRLYRAALGRLPAATIERLLQSCAKLDRLGKGQEDSDFPEPDWHEIRSLVTRFSGDSTNRYESGLT